MLKNIKIRKKDTLIASTAVGLAVLLKNYLDQRNKDKNKQNVKPEQKDQPFEDAEFEIIK